MTIQLFLNIDVDDLDEAIRFYTHALGLSLGRRLGGDWVELLGAAVPIYLLVNAPGTAPFAGAEARRTYARHWTPVHFDIVVEALEPAVQRAVSAGARREGDISEHTWGRMQLLADPFGHGLCLLQLTGRGYDEVARGMKPG